MNFEFTAEELALQQKVRKFAREKVAPIAAEVDEMDDVSWELVKLQAEEGLYRYVIPKEYGGNGLKATNICIIREELARVCNQADVNFAMQGLGTYPITLAGNDEQKKRCLPGVARGDYLATFALTEPGGGSDVLAMTTVARADGDYFVINGQKKFVSQTGAARLFSVFAKTDPTSRSSKSVSAFIVEEGTPGFDTSRALKLMAPHCIGEPLFKNCRIPRTNLIGEIGQGIKIALGTLDLFRMTVGAALLGAAETACEEALSYAKKRIAFGQPLTEFQATQFKLANMYVEIEAARMLVYRSAWMKDSGKERMIKDASAAKLFATEMAGRVADEAMQIHGGNGVIRGTIIERLYREVRAARIYEGASEIQRLTIARELLK